MNTLLSWRRASLAVLICLGLAQGCAKKQVPLAPVSGKVTVDGQAITSGQVSLIPLEKTADSSAGLSAATIDSSGAYTISTGGKPGAPQGKYKVTVTASMVPAGGTAPPVAPFNRVYQDSAQTTLRIEVINNPEDGRYDLKLTR
jgi:hypothetical protein